MHVIPPRVRSISMVLAVTLALSGCGGPEQTEQEPAPREVRTVTATHEILPLYAELPGRIEPVRIAEVRARVAGIVLEQNFEEGADVKAGDLLFQIDPAPLKAAVSRAQGELARAEAQLFDAQARIRRYEPLVRIEAVSQQEFDSARATLRSAEASRQSALAELETATLNLGYASVRAPISGRIGRALVTEGALVGQGEATLMARIHQLDPIYADFTQPVAEALKLREALKQGSLSERDGDRLSIQIEGTGYSTQGTLMFTDATVDRSTGQVSLRGRFANPDKILLPGMYVRVRAPQGTDRQAILLPQRAVRRDNDGQASVMVVGQDGIAQLRAVTTGVMQDSRWQILSGIEAGERVIVGGLSGLNPGDRVAMQPDDTQQAARHE